MVPFTYENWKLIVVVLQWEEQQWIPLPSTKRGQRRLSNASFYQLVAFETTSCEAIQVEPLQPLTEAP